MDVDTLSVRLGTLEAEIARLNALAKRVANKAKLDPWEFSFVCRPARGGLDTEALSEGHKSVKASELLSAFQAAETNVERQHSMLGTLEQILEGLTLQEEVLPSGRPVHAGYISSMSSVSGVTRSTGGCVCTKVWILQDPTGTEIYAVGGCGILRGRKDGLRYCC